MDVPLITKAGAADATVNFLLSQASINTRKAYFHALKRFFEWAEKNDVERLADVDGKLARRHIEGIMPKKEKTKLSVPGLTRMHAHAVLATFFDALVLEHIIPAHTIRNYRPKGLSKHSTPAPELSLMELRTLIASLPGRTPLGLRNRALVMFLAGTACRVGAALKLTHRALQEADGVRTAVLLEKGNTRRTIPLPPAILPALDAHLAQSPDAKPDDPVFHAWDKRARCFADRPMPYIEAYRLIKDAAATAGINKPLSPHGLRATAITALRASGFDIETAQRIAGHAHPDTTRRYDRRSKEATVSDLDALARVLNLTD